MCKDILGLIDRVKDIHDKTCNSEYANGYKELIDLFVESSSFIREVSNAYDKHSSNSCFFMLLVFLAFLIVSLLLLNFFIDYEEIPIFVMIFSSFFVLAFLIILVFLTSIVFSFFSFLTPSKEVGLYEGFFRKELDYSYRFLKFLSDENIKKIEKGYNFDENIHLISSEFRSCDGVRYRATEYLINESFKVYYDKFIIRIIPYKKISQKCFKETRTETKYVGDATGDREYTVTKYRISTNERSYIRIYLDNLDEGKLIHNNTFYGIARFLIRNYEDIGYKDIVDENYGDLYLSDINHFKTVNEELYDVISDYMSYSINLECEIENLKNKFVKLEQAGYSFFLKSEISTTPSSFFGKMFFDYSESTQKSYLFISNYSETYKIYDIDGFNEFYCSALNW